MNVSIPPELEAFVASKIASGQYASPTEVVHEALRLLEERESPSAEIAAFQHEINQRVAALDRGEYIDPESTRERLRQKSKEFTSQSA